MDYNQADAQGIGHINGLKLQRQVDTEQPSSVAIPTFENCDARVTCDTTRSSSACRLYQHHLDQLQGESGLTPKTLRDAQFYSADASELRRLLRRHDVNCSGVVIPYLHTCDDEGRCEFNVRLDVPLRTEKGEAKYLRPSGAVLRLYIPPNVMDVLKDRKKILLATEGEKKALKAAQEGFDCIAISGVDGWRQRPRDERGCRIEYAPSKPIPDLDLVDWRRHVCLAFDSDAATNANVRRALWAFRCELDRREAKVSIIRLPPKGTKGSGDEHEERCNRQDGD